MRVDNGFKLDFGNMCFFRPFYLEQNPYVCVSSGFFGRYTLHLLESKTLNFTKEGSSILQIAAMLSFHHSAAAQLVLLLENFVFLCRKIAQNNNNNRIWFCNQRWCLLISKTTNPKIGKA